MATKPKSTSSEKKDGQGFDYCAPIGGGMEMLGNLKQQLFQEHVASVPTTETSQQFNHYTKLNKTTEKLQKQVNLRPLVGGQLARAT